MFASEATCTPVVTSVVKIRAGIMFASEATVHVASLANIIPALISTTLATKGVHVASLANIIPALISTTLATKGVHVAS
jgi:hypothetical protein